ncbi:MAG TPA: murein biosynthesis integral membrane protein MurJ [Rhizomicrobium sp.]|nr:murein biosynthesis integral membrane protein MurJ [Rhizomicrobium sp.]
MFRRLLSVGGYTALSRVAGFVRDVLMAAILGAGPMSDAFLVALRLPNNFRAIFAEGAFNSAFLPRFASLKTREGLGAAERFSDRVFSWQMAAQFILLIAALSFMPWIVRAFAPGFIDNPAQLQLAIDLSRIAFPYLICITVVTQLSGMLNAGDKFKAAAAAPIFLNVAMIATLLSANWFPDAAHAAAWGVFIAGIVQLLFMVWMAARSKMTLRIGWPRWTKDVREFMRALGAATIGSASVQIGLFVDTLIASFLPAGGLTALYYADRINQLPMGTLAIAIGTVLLPEMSNRLAAGDRKGADFAQNRAAIIGLMLTLPFVAAFFAIPETIMRGLFAHGAFHLSAATMAAHVLTAYGIGLPAFVLIRILTPTFYARGDTATPVRATIASVAVNIALKFALVWGLGFGAVGIALGTALAAWVNVGALLFLARRRDLLSIAPAFWRALAPILLAAAATGGAAYAGGFIASLHVHGAFRDEIMLGVAIVFGCTAYGLVVFGLRRFLPLSRGARA